MRVCHCTGYKNNPGGVCCQDLPRTTPVVTPTGWTCGRCGASVSPYATTCPNCSRPNFTVTIENVFNS